jgi:hypothetical protein
MPKRKTYTSTAVKNRWNQKHYDVVRFHVPKGALEEIHKIAERHGMSIAAYMRHLIIADNPETQENGDIMPILRTGGGYSMTIKELFDSLRTLSD